MKLIIEDMCRMFDRLDGHYRRRYEHARLNWALNYYRFLNEKDVEILQQEPNLDLPTLLYSKYYWYTQFMKHHIYRHGEDMGVRQKQFLILEELDRRLDEGVDAAMIRRIEGIKIRPDLRE